MNKNIEKLRDFSLSLSKLFLKLIFNVQSCKDVAEEDYTLSLLCKSVSKVDFISQKTVSFLNKTVDALTNSYAQISLFSKSAEGLKKLLQFIFCSYLKLLNIDNVIESLCILFTDLFLLMYEQNCVFLFLSPSLKLSKSEDKM